MNLETIKDLLKAEVLSEACSLNMEIERIKASDLMSDVLTMSCSGSLLITGLTHSHTVRTAQIADVKAIVFVNGKRPADETVALAARNKIPLLVTNYPMFESCGLLYVNTQREMIK